MVVFEVMTVLVGIVGVLVGLFVDRMLQRRGRLRCEIGEFRLSGKKGPGEYMTVMGWIRSASVRWLRLTSTGSASPKSLTSLSSERPTTSSSLGRVRTL